MKLLPTSERNKSCFFCSITPVKYEVIFRAKDIKAQEIHACVCNKCALVYHKLWGDIDE